MKILANIGSIPIGAVNRSENISENNIFLMLVPLATAVFTKKERVLVWHLQKKKKNLN